MFFFVGFRTIADTLTDRIGGTPFSGFWTNYGQTAPYPSLAVQARNGRVADKPEVNDHYASFVLDEPHPPLEEWLRSFTIITTKPNELTTVYHRMPVILYPEDYDERLIRVDGEDPQANLLRPYPAEEMKAKEVLNDLRNVSNNHPELLNSCLMRIHV